MVIAGWVIFYAILLFTFIICAVKIAVKEALRDIIKEYDLKDVWDNNNKNNKSE